VGKNNPLLGGLKNISWYPPQKGVCCSVPGPLFWGALVLGGVSLADFFLHTVRDGSPQISKKPTDQGAPGGGLEGRGLGVGGFVSWVLGLRVPGRGTKHPIFFFFFLGGLCFSPVIHWGGGGFAWGWWDIFGGGPGGFAFWGPFQGGHRYFPGHFGVQQKKWLCPPLGGGLGGGGFDPPTPFSMGGVGPPHKQHQTIPTKRGVTKFVVFFFSVVSFFFGGTPFPFWWLWCELRPPPFF